MPVTMKIYDTFVAIIHILPPSRWVQAFFIFAAAAVLAVAVLPSGIRQLLLDYGARGLEKSREAGRVNAGYASSRLQSAASTVTSRGQVPHSWFTAFYATSLSLSLFWAYQFAVDGVVPRTIASTQGVQEPGSQSLTSVKVAWALMTLQATRRLVEQLFIVRSSNSTMWFVHWLLGLSFYIFTSVAVWIEGSESILKFPATATQPPSFKIVLGSLLFLAASVTQFRCHRHLASLKKYSLPAEGLFRYIICAHYTCECLVYLSVAMVASPDGQYLNRTILAALFFVTVNLGVTAHGTRQWYERKFGVEKLASRWTMIPLVY